MAPPRSFTVADLYAMPESERGERYELIDGDLLVDPGAEIQASVGKPQSHAPSRELCARDSAGACA